MAWNGSFVKKHCEIELILCASSSLLMVLFVKKSDNKDYDGGTCMLICDACVTDEG